MSAIHQEVVFKASPERVYTALTDAKQFSALTGGAPAEISREAGGSFSCFGGQVVGRNLELVPNRRLVQAWRAGNWGEGIYSVVKFEIEGKGAETRLVFDQSGVPEDAKVHLEQGWHAMYWEPMRKYLA
ncbi:MAG: SRPBCC family protein [Alphaproteobacteria bacterium]